MAEQAVKTTKHLLIKCTSEKSNFHEALQIDKTVFPRQKCSSAGAKGLNCPLCSFITSQSRCPKLHHGTPTSASSCAQCTSNDLPSLAINQRVLVLHQDSKLWSIRGFIHSIRPNGISFLIQLPSEQHITRGRLICPDRSTPPSNQRPPSTTRNNPQPSTQPTPITPRPKRVIKKPSRFLD